MMKPHDLNILPHRGRHVTLAGVDDDTDAPWVTRAFVPDPLPAAVELSTATWTVVANAQAALARLADGATSLPDLTHVTAFVEACASLRLAGVAPALRPEGALLAAALGEAPPDCTHIVQAVTAAIRPTITEQPASTRLGSAARALLGTEHTARTGPGFVGLPGATPEDRDTYVPPPVGPDLARVTADLHDWLDRSELPTVVTAALAHLQLETVRPFQAANGRIARTAVPALLGEHGAPTPLAVSEQLLARADEYAAVLARARTGTDLDEHVLLLAAAVRDAADAAHRRHRRVAAVIDELTTVVGSAGARGVAVTVVEHLDRVPVMTVRQVAERHDVTFQTANVAIGRLVELGVLEQRTDGNYDRVFGCEAVLDAATT